jgi:MFS family permease
MTIAQALRSPQFVVLATTYFVCCATHSGPIFHTINYAMACGIAPSSAVTIYSVEGLAGLGGRLVFGIAGDRFGAARTLIVGLCIQAVGAGLYYFTRALGEFYAVAVVFGFTYGGIMPLYAVIARQYFPMRLMGTVFGAATLASSFGMAFGPALGGWIYDRTGSYDGLYIESFAVGLVAIAIAFAFPRIRPARNRAVADAV